MLRRIKLELNCLISHITVIGLGAFLCAIGGILLWVNGGSGWYVLNSVSAARNSSSLTGVFLVWLVVYALYGVRLALIGIGEGISCRDQRHAFVGFCLTSLAYLLDLIWYALFFCTRLTWFALIILLISVLIELLLICMSRKWMLIGLAVNIIVLLAEISFVCFTVSFLLLN